MKFNPPNRFWVSIGIIIVSTISGAIILEHFFSGGPRWAANTGIALISIAVFFVLVSIAQSKLRKGAGAGKE